jgi:DNA-binding CsgD family transcriptional regulator/tetratricopeptide (TPR) repeat protein
MGGTDETLLERDAELAVLAGVVRDAAGGVGTVVLVSGEAGIGKSRLVEAIGGVVPSQGRLLIGYCDDLATPRVLGPLRDLVGSVGSSLTRALKAGDRAQVLDALRAELTGERRPAVLIVEDVHWADEATLDVLRYLVRRVVQLPVVLVLTYRDDELDAGHPLRQLLGLAARAERVRRLRLSPLSVAAVHRLSAATSLDADEVYAATSGNPYFVTEVLASGDLGTVPLTIADAVHARVAQLEPAEREHLRRLAVVPSAVPRWLVEALIPAGSGALASAEQRGLLVVTPSRVSFRHELARRAVVDLMPAAARVAANRSVLAALLAHSEGDVSRVMHHAIEAGDTHAILRHGPVAALEASTAGAHQEAAAHLRLVLNSRPELEPAAEAELWQCLAIECYTIDAPAAEALAAQRHAVQLRHDGTRGALGDSLRWLSRICWWAGELDEAHSAAEQAVEILEAAGDDHLLAMALSNRAQLHSLAGHDLEAIPLARRAIALGGDLPSVLSHALNNLGLAQQRQDPQGAVTTLQESLRVALAAGEPEHACRAYNNLIWAHLRCLQYDAANRLVAQGIELAERSEFVTFSRVLHSTLGGVRFATSDLDDVEAAAALALEGSPPVRCSALTLIGRARLRRGQPGATDALREAWLLAARGRECQRIGPAAAALGEAATLHGDPSAALPELLHADDLAERYGNDAIRAELRYWLVRAGHPATQRPKLDHPYALQAEGRWREAAQAWSRAGSRYEYAAALADSPDTGDQLRALAVLDTLGARPLAAMVRRRLKDLGVRGVPKGPRPASRANRAGLTTRQVEVVRCLAQKMTNAEIADALTISTRTVDSHVAAVLGKLGAHDRRAAVVIATSIGILPSPG